MKKRIVIPLVLLFTIAVIVASQYPKLSIATGYGAKCLASGVFVAGRDPQSVKELDLNYSIVKYTESKIDYEIKKVTTSFFGMAKQTALYREGFGCCLTGNLKADDMIINKLLLPKTVSGNWRQPWPDGDLVKDTIFPEIQKIRLESAVNNAFDNQEEMIRSTAAILIIYKGEIVGEKYWSEKEITAETKLWGWSMNKSIINAMIGVLVKQGKLDVEALAPVPEWLNDKRGEITINNLMQMCSGLKWEEDYGDISDATNMLYRESDMYRKAISVPFGKTPGSEWKYSSGTTIILSGIVRTVIGDDQQYHLFPYRELFHKIGMNSIVFETDAAGNFVGSSYSYATARDWARFGLLYFYDGVWKGDTILPKGWVHYTRSVVKVSDGKYGAQFWLNQSSELPDAPKDMFSCHGHRGQRVFIIPSRNLVIVRLGFSEKSFDHNKLIKDILMAIKP